MIALILLPSFALAVGALVFTAAKLAAAAKAPAPVVAPLPPPPEPQGPRLCTMVMRVYERSRMDDWELVTLRPERDGEVICELTVALPPSHAPRVGALVRVRPPELLLNVEVQ